jgi:hypothetical protein
MVGNRTKTANAEWINWCLSKSPEYANANLCASKIRVSIDSGGNTMVFIDFKLRIIPRKIDDIIVDALNGEIPFGFHHVNETTGKTMPVYIHKQVIGKVSVQKVGDKLNLIFVDIDTIILFAFSIECMGYRMDHVVHMFDMFIDGKKISYIKYESENETQDRWHIYFKEVVNNDSETVVETSHPVT